MLDSQKNPGRRRPNKNVYTTKSGNTIKLNRSLSERVRANREAKTRKRAAYLSSLPHNRVKRILYRLHPKRVAQFWFSREGGIMALKIVGVGIVICFLLTVGVFAYFRKDLPDIKDISGDEGSNIYYDRTGQTVLWEDYDAVKRVPVSGNDISNYMRQATVATEDKNFYKHGAFDVQGIMRAGYHDVFKKGGSVQGGSTITQQLVKLNRKWTEDRSIARKFKELILAVEVEREYSKDDILTAYLNTAPYGNIQNGVESATRDYFNKSAKDLTLPEAAMLAAIPKAPSYYSPYGASYDADLLKYRQHYILDLMAEQKMITKEQAESAKKVDVLAAVRPQPAHKYQGMKAPYFVLAAKKELEESYSAKTVRRGGWKIITTVDLRLQELAEQQVTKGMRQVIAQRGDTAAFGAIDVKTGQMVALVGGPNFYSTNPNDGHEVNFAQEPLPPGSSFKPYDYATLINEKDNAGAGSVLYDVQGALPGYPCEDKGRPDPKGDNSKKCLWDYDFNWPGPLTLRYALGGSRNVPAVKAMLTVGIEKTIKTAEDMGLKSGYNCYTDTAKTKEGPCYASAAIGDGAYLKLDEHVNALATLSRLGQYIPKTYILKIIDDRNKTIAEWKQPEPKQVIRPDAAYIVDDILSDPRASYLRPDRKFHKFKDWKFAIKTGTTNDAKDGWMVSFSTQYAAAVWVGHHTGNVEMKNPMESMTQPILQGWMQGAHAPLKASNWTQPSTVKSLPAYVITKHFSDQHEVLPSPSNDLYPSWYKQPSQSGGSSQTIDRVSGKQATSCTPELARENRNNSNANIFSIDTFVKNGNGGAVEGQDEVHKCDDAKPQITLTAPSTCAGTCSFTVTVTQGSHSLSSDAFPGIVDLIVNGQKVQSQNASTSPTTITFNYTPTTAGETTVEAKVTDSVLYTASESATVTMTPGGGSGP